MNVASSVSRQIDRLARHFNYRFFPEWALYPSQIHELSSFEQIEIPPPIPSESAAYLHARNPRLLELRQMYQGLDEKVRAASAWSEGCTAGVDLANFRGSNMWVYQYGIESLNERAHLLAAYYILANDRLGLMEKLTEDGAFGATTFKVAGKRISRDLLDSILEIDFLDRHLQIASRDDLSILDIGAGYGRLAHRMMDAFPLLGRYWLADVVAESSFVAEYYMKFRGLESRCALAPANEIDRIFQTANVNLAINIHSFSECSLTAVGWWLGHLARHQVKHLMVVPNAGNHGGQLLRNNTGGDMLPVIERNGYRLIARESKYADLEVQKFALNPTCYWLFELQEH
jgi:hypothetical protein